MGGNDKGLVIQPRDRHLFEELATMRVVDREQAKIVGGFGSTTRVNTRLLALTRAGLLRRFFLGTAFGGMKSLYTLSPKGARSVGVPLRGPHRRKDEAFAADFVIQHQLTVNEVYCSLKYGALPHGLQFRTWESFFGPIIPGLRLIPDGYVELSTPTGMYAAFLEIDLGHEHGPVWKGKVDRYLEFGLTNEVHARRYHRPFRVLAIFPTERRMRSIRKIVAQSTDKIFWFASLESIREGGFFGPVWLRTTGDHGLPLIKELP